jgi:hypothetical protein
MKNLIDSPVKIILILLLSTLFKCDTPTEPDKTPPSIIITSPVNGSTVSEIVTITAVASDNEGIKKVILFIDGYKIEGVEDNKEPFELNWNTSTYPDSSQHTILARAFDKNDNLKDSDPIILTVNNVSSRPKQVDLNPIKYENFSFVLSWPLSTDSDFDFYRLYESLFDDMSNESPIFTSNVRTDTTYTVTNINENEERYYRLTVTDTLGLETSSQIRGRSAASIPTKGLVAYYPFNGNANDESGNNLHGDILGPVLTKDRNGKENRAYYFDGIDDYIQVNNNPLLNLTNSLTISVWAQGTAFGPDNGESVCGLVSKGPLVPFALGLNSGDVVLFRISSSGNLHNARKTNLSIDKTIWYHYVGVFDAGNSLRLYINGEEIVNNTSSIPHSIDTFDYKLLIGSRTHSQFPYDPFFYFKGSIDEVRIYNRTLTDAEIEVLSKG